jgi:hypothetical protein
MEIVENPESALEQFRGICEEPGEKPIASEPLNKIWLFVFRSMRKNPGLILNIPQHLTYLKERCVVLLCFHVLVHL